MKRLLLVTMLLTSAGALRVIGSVAPTTTAQAQADRLTVTITPQTHDFGKAIVGSPVKARFRLQLTAPPNPDPALWNVAAVITAHFGEFPVRGKDDDSFLLPASILSDPFDYNPKLGDTAIFKIGDCSGFQLPRTVDCSFDVYFVPKHLGPQSAHLIVTYPINRWIGADVTGEGIPGCVMKVVPCNYGSPYSGSFTWNRTLVSPGNSHKENVEVGVKDGVATCHGSVTDTDNGNSITGVVEGPGLFAVEFEPDPTYKLVYRVTAACPTPAFPAIPADGVEATKSQPAELGHNDQNSEKQPAKELVQSALVGTIQYPAPETDPVNSVTGTVIISWTLRRK